MEVAVYARVSTENQKKERSIESQLEAVMELASRNGYKVNTEHVYADNGYSGAKLNRPGLDRLLDEARRGLFKRILVYNPDRLARKYAYQVIITEELERYGCSIEYIEVPPSDDPNQVMMVQLQGIIAEYERVKIMERLRRGKMHKLRRGILMTPKVAYGYRHIPKRDGVDGHIEVNEDEAQMVKEVFTWYACEDISIRQITARLNNSSWYTRKGRKIWSPSIVSALLRNQTYLGTMYCNKIEDKHSYMKKHPGVKKCRTAYMLKDPSEWIGISVTPLIDEQIFFRVQEKLRNNKAYSKRNLKVEDRHLFRGMLRCGMCGRKLIAVSCHKIKSYFYECTGRDKLSCGADEACKGTRIPASILDGTIWKELKEHLRSPEKIIELYKSQSKLEGTTLHGRQKIENQEAIKRIKAEIKRLTDAYVEGFIEREDFAPRKRRLDLRLRELETEKIEIEEKAERLKNELLLFTDLKEFTKRIIERLETMDFFSRQSLVRELIEKVIIKDSKLEIHHRFPLPSGANLCPNSFDFIIVNCVWNFILLPNQSEWPESCIESFTLIMLYG